MKILHAVQFYSPAVGGMEEVVKQLSTRLVKMGHDVTVLTSSDSKRIAKEINGVKIIDFNITGNLALGMDGPIEECQNYLKNSDFDIVVCFAAQQWTTDIFLKNDIIKNIAGGKVFVPTGFSGLYDQRYESYFRQMKKWFHLFDRNIFLSNDYRDINFAREAQVKNIEVIPNGASEEEFNREVLLKTQKFKILNVGNHTGQKGHRELFQLYVKASISQYSELIIVGAKNWKGRCYIECKLRSFFWNLVFMLRKEKKKIRMKTLSRKETIDEFFESSLFLFPSNIECSPIVLFEAMASYTPFLCSNAGNAKEIVDWCGGGIVLPSEKDHDGRVSIKIKDSINILNTLCGDIKSLNVLGENGHKAWKAKFTWEVIATKYEELYINLNNERRNIK